MHCIQPLISDAKRFVCKNYSCENNDRYKEEFVQQMFDPTHERTHTHARTFYECSRHVRARRPKSVRPRYDICLVTATCL